MEGAQGARDGRVAQRGRPAGGPVGALGEPPGAQQVQEQGVEEGGDDRVGSRLGLGEFGAQQVDGGAQPGVGSDPCGEVDVGRQVGEQRVGAGPAELVGAAEEQGLLGADGPRSGRVGQEPSGAGRASTSGVSGRSARPWPVPWARRTTSPGPSRTGAASSGGSSQAVPWRTTWNPAPLLGGKRKPQGANRTVREECGRPVRMAAMASLSTSMVRTVACETIGHGGESWGHGSSLPPSLTSSS